MFSQFVCLEGGNLDHNLTCKIGDFGGAVIGSSSMISEMLKEAENGRLKLEK